VAIDWNWPVCDGRELRALPSDDDFNAHQSTSERLSDFRRNPTRESAGCKPRVTALAPQFVREVGTRKEIYNDRVFAIGG